MYFILLFSSTAVFKHAKNRNLICDGALWKCWQGECKSDLLARLGHEKKILIVDPCLSFAKTTIQLHKQPMITIEHSLNRVWCHSLLFEYTAYVRAKHFSKNICGKDWRHTGRDPRLPPPHQTLRSAD